MYATINTQNWEPAYPARKNIRVRMEEIDLQIDIYKQLSCICYTDSEEPLEDPACFWIDSEHVYMRCNWGKWCTVSTGNADYTNMLLNSNYCYVGYGKDENNIKYAVAPVYHITKLPKDIFVKTDYIEQYRRLFPKKEDECFFDPGISLEEVKKEGIPISDASTMVRLYSLYYGNMGLIDFADHFKGELKFGLNAKVKDDAIDLMVRKDEQVLLLDFLDDGDWNSFIKHFVKLHRMRRNFENVDPLAKVEIGIVSDSETLEDIQHEMDEYNLDEFNPDEFELGEINPEESNLDENNLDDFNLDDFDMDELDLDDSNLDEDNLDEFELGEGNPNVLRLIPRDKLKINIYSVFYPKKN